MAKIITDLFIEQGYPYDLNLDYNAADGENLETSYTCYFYSPSIGSKQFSVVNNAYSLTLSKTDTAKLIDNLEEYVVFTVKSSDLSEEKLMSGRIHRDIKIRS